MSEKVDVEMMMKETVRMDEGPDDTDSYR